MVKTNEALSEHQKSEVAKRLKWWHAIRAKLKKAAISDKEMVAKLKWSKKFGGLAHQLREEQKKLDAQSRRLGRWIKKQEADFAEIEAVLFPAVAGRGIARASEGALAALSRHTALLQQVQEKYAQQMSLVELALLSCANRVTLVGGARVEVREPSDWDAGRLAVDLKQSARLLVKDTALLILLHERVGKWPLSDAAVSASLEAMVRESVDSLGPTTVRVGKAYDRWRNSSKSRASAVVAMGKVTSEGFVRDT